MAKIRSTSTLITVMPQPESFLTFTPTFNFKRGIKVNAGVLWCKYQVDKRGGIIGWSDGDHGEPTTLGPGKDANSVRYFNLGPKPFHGIAPGEEAYLVSPILTPDGAKASDYDNYHWWYAPSDDKFFWINKTNMSEGGRDGIFDLATGDWSHGNNGYNALAWPNGPYWTDYVKPTAGLMTLRKNSPNGFSESLDMAVAIFGERMFFIERNPNYPLEPQPRRIRVANISQYPYKINEQSHNQYMNSGICVGDWFYFIRPATTTEQGLYPDFRMREFWRVKLSEPYNQFEKLADFPRYNIAPLENVAEGNSTDYAWGPLLVFDQLSNCIIAVYDRLWVYDIGKNVWLDRTPTPWQRVLYAVGGLIPSTREIVFRPGINVDLPTNHPDRGSWSKIKITGSRNF